VHFIAIDVDGFFRHSLEEDMVLSGCLDCAPDWEGRYVRFREYDEVCGVLGCLVDEGDAFFSGLCS
jgi:hypothetical protein